MHYVRKLHEEYGYVFHMITSLSLDEHAQRLRRMNTEKLFGETAFSGYTFLDTGADKDDALEMYRDSGCWWVEDKPQNALLGQSIGLESILVDHPFNQDCTGVRRAKNWKEIYETIVGY